MDNIPKVVLRSKGMAHEPWRYTPGDIAVFLHILVGQGYRKSRWMFDWRIKVIETIRSGVVRELRRNRT